MNKLANHTALKEWSSVIDALGAGRQVILIRKGGIADPKFGLEADRFYLFPTYFHTGGEASDAITITHWCEAVRTWRVRDLELLYRLEPLTVMTRADLDERYKFRPDQAVHVIAVRAWKLAAPVTIAMKPEYAGCKSWVSVDEEIDVHGSTRALTAEELQAHVASVESMLQ